MNGKTLTPMAIRTLGFEWPKFQAIETHCVVEDGEIDLGGTLESLQSSRDFYRGQIDAAFAFKQQTGADYADFTDRRDDYVLKYDELGRAIAYLNEIKAAAGS